MDTFYNVESSFNEPCSLIAGHVPARPAMRTSIVVNWSRDGSAGIHMADQNAAPVEAKGDGGARPLGELRPGGRGEKRGLIDRPMVLADRVHTAVRNER
jgi:hypothetical protein